MKTLLMLVAASLLLLPPMADARDDWRAGARPRMQAQEQPVKRGPGPQRGDRSQQGDRGQQGDIDKRKQGKLTQEERRELLRDLDRANREIYRR
jgi:hypothetical protein